MDRRGLFRVVRAVRALAHELERLREPDREGFEDELDRLAEMLVTMGEELREVLAAGEAE